MTRKEKDHAIYSLGYLNAVLDEQDVKEEQVICHVEALQRFLDKVEVTEDPVSKKKAQ